MARPVGRAVRPAKLSVSGRIRPPRRAGAGEERRVPGRVMIANIDDIDLPAARELWARLWPLCQFLEGQSYSAAVKAACGLVGDTTGPVRAPLLPLDDAVDRRAGRPAGARDRSVRFAPGNGRPRGSRVHLLADRSHFPAQPGRAGGLQRRQVRRRLRSEPRRGAAAQARIRGRADRDRTGPARARPGLRMGAAACLRPPRGGSGSASRCRPPRRGHAGDTASRFTSTTRAR